MAVFNEVVAGDYKGEILVDFLGKRKNRQAVLYISIVTKSFFQKKIEKIYINKDTVSSYELVMDNDDKSTSGSIAKGILGGYAFGSAGLLVGSTNSHKKYLVSVVFKDGTKALCQLDSEHYQLLIKSLY